MNLNGLAEEIHQWARAQGFYNREFNFGEHLMLIVSEAAEALEDYRNGFEPDEVRWSGAKPIGIPTELADILIRVLDTMEYLGIDIDWIVRQKIDYNKTRSYMNGGKLI